MDFILEGDAHSGTRGIMLLSGSLLGTWPYAANRSFAALSDWLRPTGNSPVRGTVLPNCSLHHYITVHYSSFRLAPPPAADSRIVQKRNFGRRGGGFQAAVFLPSSLWLEKRRPGGHRHGFQIIAWITLHPAINQWVTPCLCRKQQMKFQVSPAPGCAGSLEKETSVPSPIVLVSTTDRPVTGAG